MDNSIKNSNGKKLLLVSMLTALVGSVLMCVSLFLPYITGGYAEIKSASMVSYVMLALDKGAQYTGSTLLGTIMLVIVIFIGLFSLLSVLFSIIKKPIPLIIFTILAIVVFCVLCWDFTDRGVVGEHAMSWGAAFYTFIIGAVISFAGAVFMITQKIKIKKSEVK